MLFASTIASICKDTLNTDGLNSAKDNNGSNNSQFKIPFKSHINIRMSQTGFKEVPCPKKKMCHLHVNENTVDMLTLSYESNWP